MVRPRRLPLHERDGRLAAFCWTKVHHDDDAAARRDLRDRRRPRLPRPRARAAQLTLAGLDSIAAPRRRPSGCCTSTAATPPPWRCTSASGSPSTAPTGAYHGRHRPSGTDDRRRPLPRWSVADVHESLDRRARSSTPWSGPTPTSTGSSRLFDEHGVRAIEPRAGHRRRRRGRRRRDRGYNDVAAADRAARRVRLRHRQHRQPRRAGAGAAAASSRSPMPRCARCSPASPTGSTRSASTTLAAVSDGGRRARRAAAAPRRRAPTIR